MTEDATTDTKPRMQPPTPRKRRTILNLDVLLGFIFGMLFMLLIVLALWIFGFIGVPGQDCPGAEDLCPALSVTPPICPTCEPDLRTPTIIVVTATVSPTATSTPTPTPDLAATATAACAEFKSQFPATPCP